jgi:glycosyltransferase involved in cell wall biosynthesis
MDPRIAPTLSVVVPCFNEQEVLPETIRRLSIVLDGLAASGRISPDSRMYFVDDGSRDGTWALIEAGARENHWVKGLKLSRNRGHQFALLAGLMHVPGDAVISVDADLQDDLDAIGRMIDEYRGGAEVVYGVRAHRDTDTWSKRFTAEAYYKLLDRLGVDAVFNHADYRLLGRRALDALAQFPEANVFLRGLIPQLGFRQATVHYDRSERFAGESKYPLGKMLALAWDGVTSFSAAPLRMITVLGFVVATFSLGITGWAVVVRLLGTSAVPGWASTVVPIYFLGGVQLLAIGVIGEYLAKIYTETKRRPRYFIEREV